MACHQSTPSQSSSFPGSFTDEAAFLQEENKRLQRDLECHSAVSRLTEENRELRAKLQRTFDPSSSEQKSGGGLSTQDGISSDEDTSPAEVLRGAANGSILSSDMMQHVPVNEESTFVWV